MGNILNDLTDGFFPTLGRWQDRRPLWILGGLWALGLELFSVLYFQEHLGMLPCEYCVKVRLAMVAIFLGAMVAAICPRLLAAKVVGYASTLSAASWGLHMSAALEAINLKALHTPGWFPPCKAGRIDWPLGLRVDAWFPRHFGPQGICGEDSQWFFLGFSMTQWLVLVYTVMIAGLLMMLAAGILARYRAREAALAKAPPVC
ncbi:MAG: disulfide bond formation protein B [Deltaproteobacteria bacterium]|jgi:disulfide bond formation protein DsbB|nr:disulfide bond formation protein B [Deltaproteobacteria bacterium]